jgi:TldD protein
VPSGVDPLDAAATEAVYAAALEAAQQAGCTHADVRIERLHSQGLHLRDGELEAAADDMVSGVGVRVLHGGALGFAASVAVTPESARQLVAAAVAGATVAGIAMAAPLELAPAPSLGTVEWQSPHRTDPMDVPLRDKVALLVGWSERLLASSGIDHVTVGVGAVTEDKCYADLSGTVARQRRVRIHPQLEALALAAGGDFETMRTLAPPVGRGWEYLEGDGWDWEAELAAMPRLLAEKLAAPSVEAGRYDLVIDPTNLWLTIHESIGHATELDRAVGYEAAYAGTSFATPDKLGTLQYGSPLLTVTGDRTVPHGLATVAVDDEGVAGQSFDLVRDGVLVGYQLDRAIARSSGTGDSNGCAFADSPLHVPIQRMANVSLQPADGEGPDTAALIAQVERGIYIMGDKSWSIDMQRYNFQFTGQRFFRIDHGELAGQLRDVAYQATTTEFWGSLDALGGRSTYLLGGAFNCGKGQPGQVAPVSHGAPSVLVRDVRVLNTKTESGR